ncbi:MAG: PspC domain-containing protein [Bacteroidales bacterium]|jgi:phage shock protein C|nr:PspC domain-containing protein [Bacteroidales bacterium]
MNYKKFHRSSTNKVIAGVCGGLGDYLNLDPVLVRVIFVVSVVCFGFGILLYLILWLLSSSN